MGPDDTVSIHRAHAGRTNYAEMVERGRNLGAMVSRGRTQADVRSYLQRGLDRAFRANPIENRQPQRGDDVPAPIPTPQRKAEISPYPPRQAGIHEYMQRATIQALSFSPFAQGYADREYQRQQHDLDVAHRMNHDYMHSIKEAKYTRGSQSAREARDHAEASSSMVRPPHLGGEGRGTVLKYW